MQCRDIDRHGNDGFVEVAGKFAVDMLLMFTMIMMLLLTSQLICLSGMCWSSSRKGDHC